MLLIKLKYLCPVYISRSLDRGKYVHDFEFKVVAFAMIQRHTSIPDVLQIPVSYFFYNVDFGTDHSGNAYISKTLISFLESWGLLV